MNLKLFIAFFFILIINSNTKINSQNLDFCGQHIVTKQWFDKNPDLFDKYNKFIENFKREPNIKQIKHDLNRSPISFRIPVVFHILHLGGTENISDAQIIDQIRILNRDYQKKNNDTTMVISDYKNNIADIGFEFELASIDPFGKCTNGIIRYFSEKTNWDANDLDYFIYTWPPEKYLNIYVVKSINIAPAYTFLPGTSIPQNADAIVCQSNLVGSIGTATIANSRVLTHEVGHWFGIPHIWGVTNAPGVACGDDFVDDTPITKGFTVCSPINAKVCNSNISENWQNYMDYTPCKLMFTNGQKDFMHNTILSGINFRNILVSDSNLVSTGLLGNVNCQPKASFSSSKNVICKGESAKFINTSQAGKNGSQIIWQFNGGNPSTSKDSIIDIQFLEIGEYDIKLIVSNQNGVDSIIQKINVVDGSNGKKIPISYGFDDLNSDKDLNIFNTNNDTVKWAINNNVGANNTKGSFYLENFGNNNLSGNYDYFETPFFDLSNIEKPVLSYYYSYAKKNANQLDSFRIQYSLDCGQTWKNLFNVPQTQIMANNTGGVFNDYYIPQNNNWKKVIINSFSNVATKQPSLKLRFLFKVDSKQVDANNFYIDEININDENLNSINEIESPIIKIYPNPTFNGEIKIEINSNDKIRYFANLYNTDGKLIESFDSLTHNDHISSFKINDRNHLLTGVYYIKIFTENGTLSTEKIIICN